MSTDVREQIRHLTAAFDAFVEDVGVDEIVAASIHAPSAGRLVHVRSAAAANQGSRRWPRVVGVAAAVVLVAGLVAGLGLANRDGSGPATGSEPTTGSSAQPTNPPNVTPDVTAPVGASSGAFVWPMPAREFVTLNDLIDAFVDEVLGWPALDIVGDTNTENAPQAFDLVDSDRGMRVPVIAVPSQLGWGFMQIGDAVEASLADGGQIVLQFPRDPQVISSSVTAQLADGRVVESSTTTDRVDIPSDTLDELQAALIVGRDDSGLVVAVAGGQFSGSLPVPTSLVDAPTTTLDPLVFAGTESWLPRWPSMSVSDPPTSTSGYGMQLCDGGYGTKIVRLDSTTDSPNAYSGTLCVFIELIRPRTDAVVSCSTSTPPYNYARCAHRTDRTDTAGGGTASTATASVAQQDAMRPFPSATGSNQPEVFDVRMSGATDQPAPFVDARVTVSLTPAPVSTDNVVGPPGVCFVIRLEVATVNGCVGRSLLATGLAYGAFRDGDGPIELVGIVPDEVTAIDIDGTLVTPVGNVWHRTLDAGQGTPRIIVRSADGTEASTA